MINTKSADLNNFFEYSKENTIVSNNRYELLMRIAKKIAQEYSERSKLNLNFICTHNSRRSQMGQAWSFFATEYFNLDNIYSYSGGTEVTAFHRNTVKCLQKSGFIFNVLDFSHQNPKYSISFNNSEKSILGFSKTFDDETNQYPYIAITTCDSADENCPFIPDAIDRFHLPYTDPKTADKTEERESKYMETCQQIAGEIFIIFEAVRKQLNNEFI